MKVGIQLAEALGKLHALKVIHRDISPFNVMRTPGGVIKLADFGLSVCTSEENPVTRAGTLDYMAPEVLVCPLKRLPTDYKKREDLSYTAKVDSWSLGVLAFELLTGKPPFSHKDEVELLQVCSPPPTFFLLPKRRQSNGKWRSAHRVVRMSGTYSCVILIKSICCTHASFAALR